MKRSDIRNRILDGLNESTTSPVFWSTAQIDEVIEEAQEVLAEELEALKRTALVPLQAGISFYFTRGVAPDLMVPYRIWLHSTNRRLLATTMLNLDEANKTWITVNGDPWWWFPVSWDCFGIYPVPAAAGDILRVDYFAWPAKLLDDDDAPEFAESDINSMVFYGIYDGQMKQWDTQNAEVTFKLFANELKKAKANSGLKSLASERFFMGSVNANNQGRT